ncbi:unnamed protein product [Heterobilharzia americana]|nr:unnamed protein product [Heterobilharzia americana]
MSIMPTRDKQTTNNTDCRKTGCCCACTTKSSQTKVNGRREIHEISSPLRPEQLSYVLSHRRLFDEYVMPSAWIAPFSSKTDIDKFPSSTKPDSVQIDPYLQRISPSLLPTVPVNVQSSAPASISDDQEGVRSRQRQQFRHKTDDQGRTSLVCSLSAELASVGRHRFRLRYITDRLLVVSYPPDATKSDHNEGARWLCKAFEKRYGDNYRIFNLSGFTKELHFSSRTPVIDLFWGGSLAPALEQLVTAIDQLDFWLHNHDITSTNDRKHMKESIIVNNRVAVLHCTGPKCLLATYLAVYICQSKARFGPLYGQRPGSPTARGLQWNENRFQRFKNELVLGHTILKKFYEDNLARELNPSQKRYVGYFSGLLTGALILQDRLVYLHTIVYRDSSRGRYLGQPLEAIAENNENSLYAQPEDYLTRLQYDTQYRNDSLQNNMNNLLEQDDDDDDDDHTGRWDQIFSTPNESIKPTLLITSTVKQQHTTDDQLTFGPLSSFNQLKTFIDNECGLFLKIYQNFNLMHTTRVLCPNINFRVERYIFPIEPVLPLHGDVLIACYIQPNFSVQFQELLFRAQFHTCAVDAEKLCLFKNDLDEACEKAIFPSTGSVELYFTSHRELLTEHRDNIERGCYIWTTAERESNLLSTQKQFDGRKFQQDELDNSNDFNTATQTSIIPKLYPSSGQALRILITTQEQVISVTHGLFTGRIGDSQIPMWSANHNQEVHDSSKTSRLMRQTSDPLSHPVIRGRTSQTSGQWMNIQDATHTGNQIPLYQQALLSPRVQVPQSTTLQKSSIHPEYLNMLADSQQQAQLTANQSAGQISVNRSNLVQLQNLYQQLLQQHHQLLQQQQQRPQQQTFDYPNAPPTDSNLYATVQRPPATIPSSLVAGIQRMILQQQQQQQQQQQLHIPQTQPSILPGVMYPQPGPLTTLSLPGLSSSSAFTNLARALLPTSVAYNTGDSLNVLSGAPLFTSPSLMPSSAATTTISKLTTKSHIPPVDHSGIPSQTRLGGPSNVGLISDLTPGEMLTDPSWQVDQRRRIDLQRTRFLLNEQERKLFEELKNIRNRRAGLSRLEQLGRSGNITSSGVTPLESYRRATGRISTSEDARTRARNRPLYAIGRSGSADAARVPLGSTSYYGYSDAYGSDLDEDSALLAILEQRLSRRPENKRIYSDSEMGLQEAGDIPLRIVGQQQRSGHVVDGSSQAFSGSLTPASLALKLDYSSIQPIDVTDHPFQKTSHPFYHVKVDYEYDLQEQNEEADLFPRRPRIQVVRSPVEASGQPPTTSSRSRTFSESPTAYHTQGPPYTKPRQSYTSPTKRSQFWGHSSYDEQWTRQPVADGPTIDRSSCTSPVQTHSGRLLRSPVSPHLEDIFDARGFGTRVYPGTSYPHVHDHTVRRPFRGTRGKPTVSTKRGPPSQMSVFRSPEDNKPSRHKQSVSGGLVFTALVTNHVTKLEYGTAEEFSVMLKCYNSW